MHGDAKAVVLAVETRQPRQVIGGEGEIGDRVLDSDLVRPAAQPGEFGIRQVTDRHLASDRPAVRATTAATLTRPKRLGKASVAARKGIRYRYSPRADLSHRRRYTDARC
ncbi:hypothetical protein A4G26_17950 [Mycobacterium kansasii]|nr:hypothetical protein A4G26_17950 [Mycobacterium kansasii]